MTDGSPTPADEHDGPERAADVTTARRAVVRQGVSVAVATGLYGVSFGALSVASGLSVVQTCLLSLLLFSGGSQFALVGILGGGGTAGAAIAAASLLGIRNALYGLQLGPTMLPRGWRRIVVPQLTIDESTAVAVAQSSRPLRRLGFWVTGLGVYIGWNVMTLVGALAGSALGDPKRYGLDAAASAAFIGLLWPRLRARQPVAIAIVAGIVTTALIPVIPQGLPVLAAACVGAVIAWWWPDRWRPSRPDATGAAS
ncbi:MULTISPECIES: AzlC family ABC transporter permease [unclassified Curtobacterium]|uniref:AzlC family ABC transporter permease n=1 Tax=unclassified Curtobacterium TaxID=257496 RepID=UPI000DA89878|nr:MULTISPECIES: AzlC family ABC transporter permease [unclassified Curtobacterium]PZE23455.1 branched-chain amino acid ABC transporter permease [Curtobacterium sp. MCBD17_028]PZF61517.1 branched-chain amino acid ABC transporter permease [Curtobacterium sp. MCBD17_013]